MAGLAPGKQSAVRVGRIWSHTPTKRQTLLPSSVSSPLTTAASERPQKVSADVESREDFPHPHCLDRDYYISLKSLSEKECELEPAGFEVDGFRIRGLCESV